MTDHKQALTDLLAKVEAGVLHKEKYGGMATVTAVYQHVGGWSDAAAMAAYNGSSNAAKGLHKSLLPNATWSYDSSDGHFIISYGDGPGDFVNSCHMDFARAWLIAIIKTLIVQEQAND